VRQRVGRIGIDWLQTPVTPAMDIFSIGCVIAELFTEGAPLFNLSQLLDYRVGEYSPKEHLNKCGSCKTWRVQSRRH